MTVFPTLHLTIATPGAPDSAFDHLSPGAPDSAFDQGLMTVSSQVKDQHGKKITSDRENVAPLEVLEAPIVLSEELLKVKISMDSEADDAADSFE